MKIYSKINEKAPVRTGEVIVEGDITDCAWWDGEADPTMLRRALDALPDDLDVLNVHVNSYGGSVTAGIAMIRAIQDKKKKCGDACRVVTYNDGCAASMATMVMLVGEERHMPQGALFLVHKTLTCTTGHAEDLRAQADALDATDREFIALYMNVFTGSEEELIRLLDEERFITAEEAKKFGFITDVDPLFAPSAQAMAAQDGGLIFGHVRMPAGLVASAKGAAAFAKTLKSAGGAASASEASGRAIFSDAVLKRLADALCGGKTVTLHMGENGAPTFEEGTGAALSVEHAARMAAQRERDDARLCAKCAQDALDRLLDAAGGAEQAHGDAQAAESAVKAALEASRAAEKAAREECDKANAEITSANAKFLTVNEELSSAKAELLSVNAKLSDANAELLTAKEERDRANAAADELGEKLAAAAPKVAAYETLREALLTDVKAAGIRALGAAFDVKTFELMLAGMDMNQLSCVKAQLDAVAKAALHGGLRMSGTDGKSEQVNPEEVRF